MRPTLGVSGESNPGHTFTWGWTPPAQTGRPAGPGRATDALASQRGGSGDRGSRPVRSSERVSLMTVEPVQQSPDGDVDMLARVLAAPVSGEERGCNAQGFCLRRVVIDGS